MGLALLHRYPPQPLPSSRVELGPQVELASVSTAAAAPSPWTQRARADRHPRRYPGEAWGAGSTPRWESSPPPVGSRTPPPRLVLVRPHPSSLPSQPTGGRTRGAGGVGGDSPSSPELADPASASTAPAAAPYGDAHRRPDALLSGPRPLPPGDGRPSGSRVRLSRSCATALKGPSWGGGAWAQPLASELYPWPQGGREGGGLKVLRRRRQHILRC